MIKTPEQMTHEIKAQMRGGTGDVDILHLFDRGDLTGQARLVAKVTLQQGCSIGFHEHGQEEEIYYILEGTGVFTENGQETIVSPGTATLTGNGSGHSIRNDRPEPLVLMAIVLLFA
ncbi:MAG: cupin domain-containing protein [Clostridia bacterium]|nr:cupin domain-containing protein [Clostridia bacterium]NCC74818.1 cupin domain-containing protein [Clostridia bacterium]